MFHCALKYLESVAKTNYLARFASVPNSSSGSYGEVIPQRSPSDLGRFRGFANNYLFL
jgi:hypothetical protein